MDLSLMRERPLMLARVRERSPLVEGDPSGAWLLGNDLGSPRGEEGVGEGEGEPGGREVTGKVSPASP